MPSIYQCRACQQWFKRPTEGYICTCLPYQRCPCHCGDILLTPVSYGDGTAYQPEQGLSSEVKDA